MAAIVTIASLVAGIVCFGLYVWEAIATIRAKPAAVATANNASGQVALLNTPATPVTVDQLTNLLNAASKLADSLTKAGPALTSLIGAILFLGIAAFASTQGTLGTPADKHVAGSATHSGDPHSDQSSSETAAAAAAK